MASIHWKQKLPAVGVCLALALGILFLYWPVAHHPFITLDDNQYVWLNPVVQAGISWTGVKWAFTNMIASNWFPLTWLSHMLDCQLFGLNAGGHHLTNIFFHVANSLLLFIWLKQTTGALWRSAIVAALFAWHPLRVESVAWVAERKDVLSAFFWLLTLLAYTRYAQSPTNGETDNSKLKTQNSKLFYLLALFFCAAALMAKPMAVTLPFVLLLADFWPLKRFAMDDLRLPVCRRLVVEKIPFLLLAVAESVVNFIAQKGGGATWSSDALPLPVRLANALVSYLRYVSKTFYPTDLAIIYPYQMHWPLPVVLAAGFFLLVCSGLAILRWRQNPFLFFGWFYFVGTLVPTIGLVQVGPQAMADRYSYLPSIGLFVLIVWSAEALLANRRHRRKIAALVAVTALGACCLVTARQLKYWQSSVKLFAHAIAVTPDNYIASDYLGGALELAGSPDEALPFYAEAVRIAPKFPMAQWNLGFALLQKGRAAEAAEHLAIAAQLTPGDPFIRCQHGKALFLTGDFSRAAAQLTEALRLKPDLTEAHFYFAVTLAAQGKFSEAIPHFAEAARLEPANPEIRFNYGLALLDNRQPAEAAAQFAEELRLAPNETKAHYRLALALQQQGKFAEAVAHFQQALKLTPNFPEAQTARDAILAAHPELK